MRKVKVAATQMGNYGCAEDNIKQAEKLVREAASKGAQIIQIQELFETPYFCQKEKAEYYAFATEVEKNKAVNHFKKVAKELEVVLPISFYEKKNNARYNSLAVIDANGEVLGFIAKVIFQMDLVMKRNSTSTQVIQVLKCGIHDMEKLESVFAGINGTLKRQDAWC
ncbi:Carbon-nitrogen hydrolase [Halalkalibacter krulwichiae]|uniref:Carbon-nitrogen hydrolase n=1 Tax=Halalkalibacter krulwichiae TaxID=199441 RepID=A0A1X9MKM4_9BACI|nr:Carbon-nitrogen hydrolase [Halalkalibacter krulwichiae]